MNIYCSKLWISDLDKVLGTLNDVTEIAGKSVLITGCTGLICSAIIDVFIRWNETHEKKIRILAAGRNEYKVKERFSPYIKESWFTFVPYDSCSVTNSLDIFCDYIIHGASNASPNVIVKEPVETMMSNFVGTKNLLDYARIKRVKRFLYISSSEVYGRKEDNEPIKEGEHGWIDVLNPRSSYPIGKCAAETLCASYYNEYGIESVIVRPGHIYGPTAHETDKRVSSAWAYDVAAGKDIVMKSDGLQIRSYCYCLDCASAIIKTMLKGKPVHAYNISNPNSVISVREMAEILASVSGVHLKRDIPSEIEKKGFNPMHNSSLDSSELLNLGWVGLFDAECGFSHTVKIIRDSKDLN